VPRSEKVLIGPSPTAIMLLISTGLKKRSVWRSCAAVDAGKPFGRADADALTKRSYSFNLFLSGKIVHAEIPHGRGSRHKARLDDSRPNRYIELAG
jgi:hypothetical protein